MYLLKSILISVLIFLNTMQASMIGTYSFSQHQDPDGTPSRNDQRYFKITIDIQEQQKFTYTHQTGYLSPVYTIEKGIWEIKENHIYLYTQEKIDQNIITDEAATKKYKYTHKLFFDRYQLIDSLSNRIFRR